MAEQPVVNLTGLVETIEKSVSDMVEALEMMRSATQGMVEISKQVFEDEKNCFKICSNTKARSQLLQSINNSLETFQDDADFLLARQFLNVQLLALKKFIEVASNEGAIII